MIYIIDGLVVYELTRTQYKKLLRQIASGAECSVGNYGKQLGHATSVVALSPEQARGRLEHMGSA